MFRFLSRLFCLLLAGLAAAAPANAAGDRSELLVLLKRDDTRVPYSRAADFKAHARTTASWLRARLAAAKIPGATFEALPALNAWLVQVPSTHAGAAVRAVGRESGASGPVAHVELHAEARPRRADGHTAPPQPSPGRGRLALAIIDLGADSTHPSLRGALGRLHYQPAAPGADGSARLLDSHGTAMAGVYAQLALGQALSAGGAVLPWTRLEGGLAIGDTLLARAGPETRAGRGEFARALDWLLTPSAERPPPDLVSYSQGNGRLCGVGEDCDPGAWSAAARLVDRLVDEGTLFVKSAGNRGYGPVNTMTVPGETWNGITVGNMHAWDWAACAPSAERAAHKVYVTSSVAPPSGPRLLDLVAPGIRIRTTGVDPAWCETKCRGNRSLRCSLCARLGRRDAAGDGHWKSSSGSSPAAAVVGAVALRLRQAGLEDPRLVKAVLINSAQTFDSASAPHPVTRANGRGCANDPWAASHGPWPWGAHYDRSYGWGYVDPPRALAEAAHARLDTIEEGEARCWRATLEPWDKLTLVWHRHAELCRGCGEWPALSRLDLVLRSKEQPARLLDRDAGRTALDNVLQVSNGRGREARPRAREVIVRVEHGGGGPETYALASPRPLQRLTRCPAP
jgi:hypothetical protein